MRTTSVYVICCRGQPMSRALQRLIGEACCFSDVYDGSCRHLPAFRLYMDACFGGHPFFCGYGNLCGLNLILEILLKIKKYN